MLVKRRMDKYHMSLVGLELTVSRLQDQSANHSLPVTPHIHTYLSDNLLNFWVWQRTATQHSPSFSKEAPRLYKTHAQLLPEMETLSSYSIAQNFCKKLKYEACDSQISHMVSQSGHVSNDFYLGILSHVNPHNNFW